MVTRSTSFGPSAGTADTESTIGSAYSFGKSGRIYEIRVCAYNGVADKAGTAILYLYFKNLAGPFEYAVELGAGLTDVYSAKESIIPCSIPYNVGETVTVKLKGAEALEEVTVSLGLEE